MGALVLVHASCGVGDCCILPESSLLLSSGPLPGAVQPAAVVGVMPAPPTLTLVEVAVELPVGLVGVVVLEVLTRAIVPFAIQ